MAKNFSLITRICEIVTKYSIYILAGLMPIVFLPWTSDYLDFNKQLVLVVFAFVALFAWLIKSLISGGFNINLSKINIAILILFMAYVLSAVFSIDKYSSFWGWPRVVSESLLTMICLVISYFLINSSLSKKEIFVLVNIFSCSSLAAIFYGLLQLLGIYIIPVGSLKSTSFNTIGMVGALGMLAAIILPLVTMLEVFAGKWLKIVYGVGIILMTVLFVVVNYSSVWWVVLAGSIVLAAFLVFRKDLFDLRWLTLPMFFFVLSLFFIALAPQFSVPSRSIEVNLNQQATFDITLKTLEKNPITGSGLTTFVYDFSKYKSNDFNQSSLWNLRFNGGVSKFLTLLATAGILGAIGFLTIIGAAIFYGVKLLRKKGESSHEEYSFVAMGAFASLAAAVVMSFIYNSNLSLEFAFFLLIAIFVALYASSEKSYRLASSSFLTLTFTFLASLLFIFGVGLLLLHGQRYAAEVYYKAASAKFSASDLNGGIAYLEKAVKMNPNMDLYLTDLSQAYLSKINIVVNDKDMSDTDKSQNAQLLVNNSINAAKMATDLNPNNVSDWSIRGYVYQSLMPLNVSGMDEWAIKSYQAASDLEPANPYYPTQAGLVYLEKANLLDDSNSEEADKSLDMAMEQFNKAIELKSDYAAARYEIAMVYAAKGKTEEELKALKDAKQYSPNDVGLAFQIGVLYYQRADYQNAKTELERAVALNPSYSNALYFLGLTYYKLGKTDDAVSVMKKIADLNPDNTDLPKIIENLKAGKSPLAGIVKETPAEAPITETPPEQTKK